MQNLKLINHIKKLFSNKFFISVFLFSFLSVVLFLAIIFSLLWYFKADVFNYFAKGYLQETEFTMIEESNSSEKEVEKQPVFSQESFVINTVKKTNPAVVSIIVTKDVPKYEIYNDPNFNLFNNMFPGFNFSIPQYRQNGTEKKEIGGGSGFFVSSDGLIVTNKHVVNQKDVEYTVLTNDGKKHDAKVIARDPVLDIALIRINGSDYPYLSLGNSDSLLVGQTVIAIGNALGEFRNTVSVGVVSGLARSITAGDSSGKIESLDHVIQTDAAINPGNSGGPLLDLYGKVIGVNVAVAEGSQSVAFALPINSVIGSIQSVKTTGKIIRPYLGVRYVIVDQEMKEKNDLKFDYGVIVKQGSSKNELAVIPGSPADKAGIVENDIILEIDGIKINKDNTLVSLIRQKNVGDLVSLKVLHKGEEKNIKILLEAAKD